MALLASSTEDKDSKAQEDVAWVAISEVEDVGALLEPEVKVFGLFGQKVIEAQALE